MGSIVDQVVTARSLLPLGRVFPPAGVPTDGVRRQDAPPLFDPHAGTVVLSPPGEGPGWWVGAPSAAWDGSRFYLAVRTRRPQPERGARFQILAGDDGERFAAVWSVRKEELGTSSIERGALIQADAETWRLYLSYVDPADGRWRIDLLEANAPERLDPAARRPILTAADIGGEGVKDPWLCRVGETWHMIVSFAPTPAGVDAAAMHRTNDVYNTGTTKSLSGLATSDDGIDWAWHGPILEPSADGWDAYAARLNSVYRADGRFVGLYDGSRSVAENYEERCGVAVSDDLRTWRKLSPDGPAVGNAGGPGTVRYAEAIQGPGWLRFYYEYTRPDGAHELRTSLAAPGAGS